MPEQERFISLARWQGSVDQVLKEHGDRLGIQSIAIESLSSMVHELKEDLREIKDAQKSEKERNQFRWTKFQISMAALAFVVGFILNAYTVFHG